MASSIIHLAVTNELIARRSFQDPGRLKFGAILPDAGRHYRSHLKRKVWGLNKRTYHLEEFRERYRDLIRKDDLYLGYYLHLVQDLFFRHFTYDRYHWNPSIPGNIERLHKDYTIINRYVAEQYGLINDITLPEGFAAEPINELEEFDIEGLMAKMESYFILIPEEEIFFFTREMADEYIREAVEICLRELEALDEGEALTDSYEEAWEKQPYSLLETTLNTRDLGRYRIDGTRNYTKQGRIIRSDVAEYPSQRDIDFLLDADITTIIDLRTEEEVARKPHGLAGVPGFTYYNIPITEGSGIPESPAAVPESYYRIAYAENIREVFRTIAEAEDGVLYGCTAGKDRTGVITAMLLWLVGVRRSDIIYDYMRTAQNDIPRFDLIRKNFPEIDMNIVIPHEDNIRLLLERLENDHGSAADYFSSVGIDHITLEKLKNKLL